MALSKNELSEICQQGMQVLSNEKRYPKTVVWQKLESLGFSIGKTTAHNILSGKGLNAQLLPTVAEGIQVLISEELGMEWQGGNFIRTIGADFVPKIVGTAKQRGFTLHADGRLPISHKVAFFKDAQHEVIEFGLTLSRFASNLSSGSKSEFRVHVEEALRRGVNFRCYLLNPVGNVPSMYFNDRANIHAEEREYMRKTEEAIAKLRSVQAEFSRMDFKGKFEVFAYEHFPYGYFMAVDGATPYCKMLVSPYLFGIKRADAPVLEFSRKNEADLYHIYWQSLTALMKNAKRIIPAQT